MDGTGGEKGVDTRALGSLESGRRSLDVERAAAGQSSHLHPWVLAAHRIHGFIIAVGGDREAGFEDVHAQLDQFAGHAKLFRNGHAASGRLLAVPECRVEDVDSIAHRGFPPGIVPLVCRMRFGFSKFILLSYCINNCYCMSSANGCPSAYRQFLTRCYTIS